MSSAANFPEIREGGTPGPGTVNTGEIQVFNFTTSA